MKKSTYLNAAGNRLITERVVREHGQKPRVEVTERRVHGNYPETEGRRKDRRRTTKAGFAAVALSVGLGVGASALNAESQEQHRYDVDREAVSGLDPKERDEKFDTLRVSPGDNLSTMAEAYVETHGGNYGELLDSLEVQARQIDLEAGRPMNAHVIQPGEEYFIPKN